MEWYLHSVDILRSAKPVPFISAGMSDKIEKMPVGKSANITYTRCDCRKCACCAVYYQADLKRHIEMVKMSTFIQPKKYEFDFKNK